MQFTSDRSTTNGRTIALGALAALVVAGVIVAALGGSHPRNTKGANASGSSAPSTTVAARAPGAPDRSFDAKLSAASSGAATAGPSAPTSTTSGGATTPSPVIGPQVVRTADLQLKVRGSFDTAVDRATSPAGQPGGFVTSPPTSFPARP